jgi:hypothetical protein
VSEDGYRRFDYERGTRLFFRDFSGEERHSVPVELRVPAQTKIGRPLSVGVVRFDAEVPMVVGDGDEYVVYETTAEYGGRSYRVSFPVPCGVQYAPER